MKRIYEEPVVELTLIAVEDIITASEGVIEGNAPDTGGSHDFGERT